MRTVAFHRVTTHDGNHTRRHRRRRPKIISIWECAVWLYCELCSLLCGVAVDVHGCASVSLRINRSNQRSLDILNNTTNLPTVAAVATPVWQARRHMPTKLQLSSSAAHHTHPLQQRLPFWRQATIRRQVTMVQTRTTRNDDDVSMILDWCGCDGATANCLTRASN